MFSEIFDSFESILKKHIDPVPIFRERREDGNPKSFPSVLIECTEMEPVPEREQPSDGTMELTTYWDIRLFIDRDNYKNPDPVGIGLAAKIGKILHNQVLVDRQYPLLYLGSSKELGKLQKYDAWICEFMLTLNLDNTTEFDEYIWGYGKVSEVTGES